MPELSPRAPIADDPLSMILVACNAELFLDHLLDRWRAVLDAKVKEFEIILVDDASKDNTLAQAVAWKGTHPELTVVESEAPHGIGAACRTGLAAAKLHPLVAYAEFSPDYNPDDFTKFLEAIDQVDVVSGLRENRPSRWSGRSLLERWVFGVRLLDPSCPFKLFRRTVFEHLPLQSRGDFVHTEVVAKANFLGCLLTEVPVECKRTGISAPDPFWSQDMVLVFRTPDFGPPPQQHDAGTELAQVLATESAKPTPGEDEIL